MTRVPGGGGRTSLLRPLRPVVVLVGHGFSCLVRFDLPSNLLFLSLLVRELSRVEFGRPVLEVAKDALEGFLGRRRGLAGLLHRAEVAAAVPVVPKGGRGPGLATGLWGLVAAAASGMEVPAGLETGGTRRRRGRPVLATRLLLLLLLLLLLRLLSGFDKVALVVAGVVEGLSFLSGLGCFPALHRGGENS